MNEMQIEHAIRIIRILAISERIEIIKMLIKNNQMSTEEIQLRMNLPKVIILRHLYLLLKFGLIKKEKHGYISTYSADSEKFAKIADISEYLYNNVQEPGFSK
jgi:predicted transcriptional regulator